MDTQAKPILLYNDECGVCRRLARWVRRSAETPVGETGIIERPIGDDPQAVRALNPNLDIWDAYATIHLLMPDASMKTGGEAVAEVLRILPNTRWFSGCFAFSLFGVRPFQVVLNAAYTILADIRPLFGCESCGTPSKWVRPIRWLVSRAHAVRHHSPPHFTPREARATPLVQESPREPSVSRGA
jgi:predicted DCC family thiol-disulfide oxidoreductase YuxK